MNTIKGIWRVLRIMRKKARNLYWRARLGKFAFRRLPLSSLSTGGFRHEAAYYACPIICPAGQKHIFENKIHNLELGVSHMQGLVLGPGEIFSFWGLLGEPSQRNGYREGATFIRHKVSSAVGGGLCQLSGLLHNLALLVGCPILERHEHSIDAYGEDRYIPLGRDATVTYPRADLCFQNPHSFSLVLKLDITRERAQGWFLSPQTLPYEVVLEVSDPVSYPSPIVEVAEKVCEEKGLDGKRVKSWRVFRSPGGEEREFLFESFYHPTPTYLPVATRRRL